MRATRSDAMKAREWIDQAKTATGIESDYALAKHLGVTHATVSRYRNGKGTLDNEVATKIAQILGVPEMRVIADQEEERARTPAKRAWWRGIGTAAAVILSVVMTAKKPEASVQNETISATDASNHYAKLLLRLVRLARDAAQYVFPTIRRDTPCSMHSSAKPA
jgi:predicted transcriptional regulator